MDQWNVLNASVYGGGGGKSGESGPIIISSSGAGGSGRGWDPAHHYVFPCTAPPSPGLPQGGHMAQPSQHITPDQEVPGSSPSDSAEPSSAFGGPRQPREAKRPVPIGWCRGSPGSSSFACCPRARSVGARGSAVGCCSPRAAAGGRRAGLPAPRTLCPGGCGRWWPLNTAARYVFGDFARRLPR